MRRGVVVPLLLLAAPALARNEADMAVAQAIREFNSILSGRQTTGIESVRDTIVANLKNCSPKVAKSIRFQLDRGYKSKYKASDDFCKCISQMLAAGGKEGIAKLFHRYKASSKRHKLRVGIAEALGECGDEQALSTLLKIIHDKTPEVATAAVKSCASYAKVKADKRKNAMRKLIDRYMKVSDDAAGKKPESREMHMYKQMDPAMRETLKAFSGGESLDSALAWDAWWREKSKQPWKD